MKCSTESVEYDDTLLENGDGSIFQRKHITYVQLNLTVMMHRFK
jgi:hypothetical protein